MQTKQVITCPNCHTEGPENFVKAGYKQLFQKRVQRFQCKICGKLFHT